MKAERNDLKMIGQIASVRLRPGDLVVVKVKEHLTREAAKKLEEYLREYFPAHRVLVLSGGIGIEVARGAGA